MKKIALSILLLAGLATQLPAQDQTVATSTPASPGSYERIKEKLDEMNSRSMAGIDGVVKMYQAGVDSTVIQTYIRNSRLSSPTPRDLIYLHDQKIPQEIVSALIEHGRTVDEETAKNTPPAPVIISPPAPALTTTYNNTVYNDNPGATPYAGYDYTTYAANEPLIIPYDPYRSYGSYYSPPFYSYPGYYWPASIWAWDDWNYRRGPLIIHSTPRYRLSTRFDGPRFGNNTITIGTRPGGGLRAGGPIGRGGGFRR